MEKGKETYKLPEGWIWTNVSDLFVIIGGGTPTKGNSRYWGGKINWASVKDVKSQFITTTIDKITKEGVENSNTKIAETGDIILVTRISPGQVSIVKTQTAINQDLKILKLFGDMNPSFVYHLLKSQNQQFIEASSGTTVKGLKVSDLAKIELPLPPLQEQQRIVSKIESLFSELDEAEKGLYKAKKQLEVYRQVLLKSAFEGEMTKNWRKKHSSFKHLPQDLIEKDLISRRSYWIKRKEMEFEEKGKQPKTLDWQKKYPIPIPLTEEKIIIPKEWERTNWSQISNWITYGFTKTMPHEKTGNPIITGKNVIHNKISFEQVHFTSEDAFNSLSEKDIPKCGDILITKDGTLGRAAIVEEEMFCINQSIAVIWLRSTIMNKQFLLYYIQTPFVQSWIKENAKGSTIKHLSVSDFPRLEIPIPSLEEQSKIVEELELQFTLIENLEKTIERSLKDIVIFKHSILKKAFEGTLIVQVSTDEPANLLLQKIRIEKSEYLKAQIELDKLKPKKKRQMDKKKTVLEILKESKEPISTQELWTNSIHEGDIESFYSEIKEIFDQLDEIKESTESLLSLKK